MHESTERFRSSTWITDDFKDGFECWFGLSWYVHDMFVCKSGLGREQGTKNDSLTPQDPQFHDVFHEVFVH